MPNVHIVCKTARFCLGAIGPHLLEPMARIVRTQEHIQIQRVRNEEINAHWRDAMTSKSQR